MSNDKFKIKKGLKLETNSTAGDEAGELRSDGTVLKFYGTSEKTIATTDIVSGTNTGDVTLAAVGSSPNANGASLSGQALNLQPADATNPGVVTTGAQTFAGAKTFSTTIVGSVNGNAATVTTNANLTGPITSTGNATAVAAQTGTGSTFVMQTSPALTTPDLGTPSAAVLTNASGTATNLTAGKATNLAGGSGGTIPYQSAADTTAMLANGTAGQVLQSNGTTVAPSWVTPSSAPSSGYEISNLGLATSVAASALTIALKQSDGSTDPGAGAAAVKVGMRSSTLASGLYNQRSATAATSLVISSGSTLGQTSAVPATIWVYLIDNAGTLELAASGCLFGENQVVSTTAEGGAGAADSASVLYSTTARSSVPVRLIGKIVNTQSTAGTWASAGTVVQVGGWPQIVASDAVSALYTGAPPTGSLGAAFNIATYGTKVKDTHNAYSSGTYTVPVSGTYHISAALAISATYALNQISLASIHIDGTRKYDGSGIAGGAQSEIYPQVSVGSVPLLAGALVTIKSYTTGGGSPSYVAGPTPNYFSITRTGDY